MTLLEIVPTKVDLQSALEAFDSNVANLTAKERLCKPHYRSIFNRAIENSVAPGHVAANQLLAILCSCSLAKYATDAPLGKEIKTIQQNIRKNRPPGNGLIPSGDSPPTSFLAFLELEHYDILAEILSDIDDPELKARVADVLWLVRRNPDFGKKAITGYLGSFLTLKRDMYPYSALDRLIRAIKIENELGTSNGAAFCVVESELQQESEKEFPYYKVYLMEALLSLKMGDSSSLASLAEAAARGVENEDDPDWQKVDRYWKAAIEWWKQAKNFNRRKAACIALAESYVDQADALLIEDGHYMPYSKAASWIEQAILTLRNEGSQASKDRARELQRRLVGLQAQIPNEMTFKSYSVDSPAETQRAQQCVSGLELTEALKSLAFLYTPCSPKIICRESKRTSVSQFPHKMIGVKGTTVAQEVQSEDKKVARRKRRCVRMVEYAFMTQSIKSQLTIEPALQVINAEHLISSNTFLSILEFCNFVPPGHAPLFARGLGAGIQGDWFVSAHLLIPQLELAFRSILFALGVTPPEAVQRGEHEWGMQEYLYEPVCFQRLSDIFGEALIYDARVLLVEKFAANLRPNIIHGILPQTTSDSLFVFNFIYLWWLTLRFCFTILRKQADLLASQSDVALGPTAEAKV